MNQKYQSNDEFYRDFDAFVQRLDFNGHHKASEKLRHGISCLNGLTDGWALLMESVEETLHQYGNDLSEIEKQKLKNILVTVRQVVFRK